MQPDDKRGRDDDLPIYGAYPGTRQPRGRTQELRDREEERYSHYERTPARREREAEVPKQPVQPPKNIKKRNKRGHPVLWTAAFVFNLLCIAALAVMMLPQLLGIHYVAGIPTLAFINGKIVQLDTARYDRYWESRETVWVDTIYPGVRIDGVDVGGMTRQQAIAAVNAVPSAGAQNFSINVNIDGRTWTLDSSMVPLKRNTGEMVDLAWACGRGNTASIRGTNVTPFQERLSTIALLQKDGLVLYTTEEYDHDVIKAMAEGIAAEVNYPAVDAEVASFDVGTKTFTFTEDSSGEYIDPKVIADNIELQIALGGNNVTLTPQILLADVTRAELMNSFGKVSTYSTRTTDSKPRNTNVRLSAEAISGTVVKPGEIFSFNDTVGERTESKGYKAAAAISGGASRDEIGGGVCQTSSTLFNAVMRANMTIIARSPHAWPSSYVDKGLDATVNWPSLDFKFRNDTEWPIFIVAHYADRRVTVDVYGHSLGDAVTIDLESETTRTIKAPSDILFKQNPSLPAGTNKETVKARDGYEVDTYRVWYRNGKEFKREKLCHSTYKVYQKTVEYN